MIYKNIRGIVRKVVSFMLRNKRQQQQGQIFRGSQQFLAVLKLLRVLIRCLDYAGRPCIL